MYRALQLVGALLAVAACGRIDFDAHPCSFTAVATGRRHTCAIDRAGDPWCWGENVAGQVLPGGPSHVLLPARVGLPEPVVAIGAGRNSTCARTEAGLVYCWGDNYYGQLGNGTTAPATAPVAASALGGERAIDLVVAGGFACIRRASDQAVACWGENTHAQLGVASPAVSPTPIVIPGTAGATALSVGHCHACAVVGGVATCWGRNSGGQLGDESGATPLPPQPVAGLGTVEAIAGGGRFACAIEPGGALRCWGRNRESQLGRGAATIPREPAPGPVILADAVELALGTQAACARRRDGSVACWGHAGVAIDAAGGSPERPTPTPITSAIAVSSSYWHACALAESGELSCWGDNREGQLGRGTRSIVTDPTEVDLPVDVTDVGVGSYHACGRAGASLYCWGGNGAGQIGDGTRADARRPVLVSTGLSAIDGVALGAHTCAWGAGTVRCWGSNIYGEATGSIESVFQLAPTTIPGITQPSHVAVGYEHTCAIDGGVVRCWGNNVFGQLGNGTTTASPAPVPATGLTNATRVAASTFASCAIDSGVISCWGHNGAGQLGDGTTTNHSAPMPISVPSPVEVLFGRVHVCALTTTGAVHCWGGNDSGQLGQADRTSRSSPAIVPLPRPARAIAVGDNTSCALLDDGTAACWGANPDKADPDVLVPTLIPELAGVDQIAVNYGGACARRGGLVSCWGDPALVGGGDTSRATPVPIGRCIP